MDANSIIILGLCVVLFIVLILLYVKDSQTNKKFDRYDHIVNDNMNEIFILKKEVAKLKEELEMFLLLTSVSSIGPKNAIGVLSSLSVNDIKIAIVNSDIDKLTVAKGIGKKTASRIILELMDKVKKMPIDQGEQIDNVSITANEDFDVAKEALLNLGYAQNDINNVLMELNDMNLSLEELVKESLKRLV